MGGIEKDSGNQYDFINEEIKGDLSDESPGHVVTVNIPEKKHKRSKAPGGQRQKQTIPTPSIPGVDISERELVNTGPEDDSVLLSHLAIQPQKKAY